MSTNSTAVAKQALNELVTVVVVVVVVVVIGHNEAVPHSCLSNTSKSISTPDQRCTHLRNGLLSRSISILISQLAAPPAELGWWVDEGTYAAAAQTKWLRVVNLMDATGPGGGLTSLQFLPYSGDKLIPFNDVFEVSYFLLMVKYEKEEGKTFTRTIPQAAIGNLYKLRKSR